MKDFFEDKEKRIPGNMEYDIEQIRNELGKGMNIEKIAEKLNLDQAYVEFCFGLEFYKSVKRPFW